MKLFKLLTVTLALGLSSLAMGLDMNQTGLDCDKAKFYAGSDNTREPAQYSKKVKQALRGNAMDANLVQSISLPSKQTR